MTRRKGWAAIAGLLITMAAIHLVLSAAMVPLATWLTGIRGTGGRLRSIGVFGPVPELAVISDSLAGPYQVKSTLSKSLARAFKVKDAAILNMTYPNRNVADLLAELLRARDIGARAAVVVLNPFIINSREHRFDASRKEMLVTTELSRAVKIFPVVSPSVRREILRQYGVEGVLAAAAGLWAPARLRAVVHEGNPDSAVLGGLHLLLRDFLFGKKGWKPAGPNQWEEVCDNFESKLALGVDTDVLKDLFGEAARGTPPTLFVLPPLNRAGIAENCETEALENLDKLAAELASEARQAGVKLVDQSGLMGENGELYMDYGHFRLEVGDEGFDRWARALGPVAASLQLPYPR